MLYLIIGIIIGVILTCVILFGAAKSSLRR